MSSSMTHMNLPRITPSDDGKPERSRNAKAQARHREKRKLYIEQLESTVTKLQTALGYTPDQVAALPPPLVKIRELETENQRLHQENEDLRRMLAENPENRGRIPPDFGRRTTFHDGRECDEREYDITSKKRKVSDPVYLQNEHRVDARPPPPLTIPQPMPHHSHHHPHSQPQSYNGGQHANNSSSSLYLGSAPAFQMPHTPSGSSSTSSPPFSPAPMRPPHSRPPSVPVTHNQAAHSLSYGSYGSVKAEESHYGGAHHSSSQYPPSTLPPFQSPAEEWHYAADRTHHR